MLLRTPRCEFPHIFNMVRFMLCFLYANTEARKKVWKIPASFFRLVAEGLAVVVFFDYVSEFEAAR